MSDRYTHALWCDDIRQEIGNKPSFMGAYVAGMTVGSLPAILSRLCIYVWVSTTIDKPFKTLSLRILRDDGFVLAEMPADNIENTLANLPTEANSKRINVMFGINMAGVEIPEGCKYFAVKVETESETLEGPKLMISVNPDLSPAA